MNPFRRLKATITAQFGDFLDQIENHEAVADALIREVERSAAKARVQLRRVKDDGERLGRRVRELGEARAQWTDRALRIGDTDRPRALECVRRIERADGDRRAAEEQLGEQRKLEAQLTRDLASIEENLAQLRRKRNALASRQSRAEALRVLQGDDLGILTEIDGIFARWETKVTEYEVSGGAGDGGGEADDLATGFLREEEKVRLEATLDRLLKQGDAGTRTDDAGDRK